MIILDKEGYPTEEFLEWIKNYDLTKEPLVLLLTAIKDAWWYEEVGFVLKRPHPIAWDKALDRKDRTLELHCIGWSGNESIIDALQANSLFFPLYWRRSEVGGHYYFRIPVNKT